MTDIYNTIHESSSFSAKALLLFPLPLGAGSAHGDQVDLDVHSHRPGSAYTITHSDSSLAPNIAWGEESSVDSRLLSSLQNVYSSLAAEQQPLGEEFEKILSDKIWDLYAEG